MMFHGEDKKGEQRILARISQHHRET